MATTTLKKQKEFDVIVLREKFAEKDTRWLAFDCKASSDVPELQRFDDVLACMAIKPALPESLVVVRNCDKYSIQRHSDMSGEFVATVFQAGKKV